ncbi:23S rRNA (uracil(1939)-C(5))-methyltransferase RlmD [Ileibacterium valens]|uniref:23S rRNA (uracil(1939)-C(5))-methyltransferase RlmD n=1 Tax=Ileibacterium valens TaxID=1862668 RepID=UPI00259B0E16|nr:23S rRNA (uracil(1939)-C(5))-methyltransferase RlmD [Ileibacterium valens]
MNDNTNNNNSNSNNRRGRSGIVHNNNSTFSSNRLRSSLNRTSERKRSNRSGLGLSGSGVPERAPKRDYSNSARSDRGTLSTNNRSRNDDRTDRKDSIRVFHSGDAPAYSGRSRFDSFNRPERSNRKMERTGHDRRFSRNSDGYESRPYDSQRTQAYKLKVQRWGINGEGIAYKNRKPVFVDGVIPEETALIEITEDNEKYAKGKLVRILEESPRRRHPVCPIADQCGGCALMHVDYKGQVRAKEKLLKEALKKYAGYTGEIEPIVKNPTPLAYRNACKFPFGKDEEGKITTGMYERNSNDFVPVARCLIHTKKLEKIRHEVEEVLQKYEMKPFDKESGIGLRNLVLKEFDDRVHIILVTSEMDLPEEMVNELLSLENAASIWQSIKDEEDMEFEMFGNRMIHLGGDMKMTLSLDDLSLELLPRSFFQLNTAQAKQLYEQVVEWIPENTGLLVEAYSGIGAMSLFAADKCDEVIGIEVVEDAIANAKENALANGKENVRFICGDAGEELEKVADAQQVDFLLVDPPRSGLNKKMKESIHKAAPEKIIYVSCNPATLGKDLAEMNDQYQIEKIVPFDMFSQTPHVEVACLLSRKYA